MASAAFTDDSYDVEIYMQLERTIMRNDVIVYFHRHILCLFPKLFFCFFPLQPILLIISNLTLLFQHIYHYAHLFISVVVCVDLTETSIYLFFILDDISFNLYTIIVIK